ncbi:hypothetical protein [Chitinophaga sp.]|uniref:hypothetical protein n=1 Tax=Chitinophaga sp. TaxID=1869181 RepID=UPI002F94075E
MNAASELKRKLKPGKVYRRGELAQWTNAVDRHLAELVEDGTLKKLQQGLYYYPKQSTFGQVPPEEKELVRSFLKDKDFLLTSPNAYNSLGVGTTQLYNKRIVYNHKRHGLFQLGSKLFDFRIVPHYPKKVTPEYLLVDLAGNMESLAEDPMELTTHLFSRMKKVDQSTLMRLFNYYGNAKARKLYQDFLRQNKTEH